MWKIIFIIMQFVDWKEDEEEENTLEEDSNDPTLNVIKEAQVNVIEV